MSVCDSETALLQANPTARSELDVLKRRITELEAELEKKNVEIFDLNNENQKLRKELESRIEELEKDRADSDAENIKRDAENAELKVRVAKLEQDSSVVDEQSQDAEDGKVFLLRGFKIQRESTAPEMPSVVLNVEEAKFSAEDDSMDAFLIEQHKKEVSEEKIQRESAVRSDLMPPVSPSCTSETVPIVNSHPSRDIKPVNIVNGFSENSNETDSTSQVQAQRHTIKATEETDMVTDFVQSLLQELLSPRSHDLESIKFSSPAMLSASISLKKLANLFYQANNAKKNTIKAKRTEISSWCCYSERFEDKVMELRSEDKKLTDQTARKRIYNEIKPLLTGVSDGYLRVMTCKARKINTH
jgi:hypothetical protein